MSRIYLYKLTVDKGGAPCVFGKVLTLAICKPAIRRTAKVGDIVLGFAANDVIGHQNKGHYAQNRLIYLARIGANLDGRDYYSDSWHSLRPDCIYELHGAEYRRRKNAKFHKAADLERDLGSREKGYPNARVLMSCEFRYFAEPGPLPTSSDFPGLLNALRKLTQGSRVNHSAPLQEEVNEFVQKAWKHPGGDASTPVPERHCDDHCDQDDGVIECECR